MFVLSAFFISMVVAVSFLISLSAASSSRDMFRDSSFSVGSILLMVEMMFCSSLFEGAMNFFDGVRIRLSSCQLLS